MVTFLPCSSTHYILRRRSCIGVCLMCRRTIFHARVELCRNLSTAGRDVCVFNIRGTAFLWHQVHALHTRCASDHCMTCVRTLAELPHG